jgi:sec-independent protein translocase protein TatA
MFGDIGIEKILLLLLVVLLLFGARRIPELAGSMGKGIREFKRNLSDPDRASGSAAVGGEKAAGATRPGDPADRLAQPAAPTPVSRDDASAEPKRLIR